MSIEGEFRSAKSRVSGNLARYRGMSQSFESCSQAGVQFARPPESNFIDGHLWNKLAQLGIPQATLPMMRLF